MVILWESSGKQALQASQLDIGLCWVPKILGWPQRTVLDLFVKHTAVSGFFRACALLAHHQIRGLFVHELDMAKFATAPRAAWMHDIYDHALNALAIVQRFHLLLARC
jgi:hypothetical protein